MQSCPDARATRSAADAARLGARQLPSGRAISLGSFTGAGDFVLQLIRLKSLGSELQESKQLSSCGS